jgi:hypothetical protein
MIVSCPDGTDTAAIPRDHGARLLAALAQLRRACEYARELRLDLWDFALEIQTFWSEGLSNNDLRWLVCKGFALHAEEVTHLGDDRRTFRPLGRFNLCAQTCFVLTESGAEFLHQACDRRVSRPDAADFHNGSLAHVNGHRGVVNGHESARIRAASPVKMAPPKPCWDSDRQELRVGVEVVKRFKVPAPNQETVLAAFEEEGWPHRIDDPIPPHPDQDPKRRLHDTINSLNRNQRALLIHFLGDGRGLGVRWEPKIRRAQTDPRRNQI